MCAHFVLWIQVINTNNPTLVLLVTEGSLCVVREFYSAIQPQFNSNGLYIELILLREKMLIFLQELDLQSLDSRLRCAVSQDPWFGSSYPTCFLLMSSKVNLKRMDTGEGKEFTLNVFFFSF